MSKTCENCIHYEICRYPLEWRAFPDTCWKYEEERQHGEWIPCSEQLPEDDKEVLVYVRRKDVEKSEMNGLHIARKHRMEGDPEGNNNFWGIPVAPCEWRIEGWSYFFEPEVLAWMPLPKPYKGGEAE